MPRRYVDTYFDVNSDSDEDETPLDEKYLKKVEKLKLKDYLSYKPTKELLDQKFDDYLVNNIEEPLKQIYNATYEGSQTSQIDLLSLADPEHVVEFIDLVRYHIKPKYETDDMKYEETIMKRLISKVEREREKHLEEMRKKKREEAMNSESLKTFDWKTKKYD